LTSNEPTGDIEGPPVRAYLTRVEEDRIGREPERVEVRVVRQRDLYDFEEIITQIDLAVGLRERDRALKEVAHDAPFDIGVNVDDDSDEIRYSLMWSCGFKIRDQLLKFQRETWTDIDERIKEKRARQRAMKYLPDDDVVVQVCEVVDPSASLMGCAQEVIAFIVSKQAPVIDGLHFETIAMMSISGADDTLLEEVSKRMNDQGATFSFRPCAMASDDLVAQWRARFDGIGLTKDPHGQI
jgi:hypothetical protein